MSRSAICRVRASVFPPAPLHTPRRSSTVPVARAGSSKDEGNSSRLSIPRTATASTILAVTREVGEMLRGVPYIKAVSGIILEIIKIKEEVTDNKWRCQELIDKVVRRSETIFVRLKKVLEAPGREGLKELENDLVAYTALLQDIYNALLHCTSRKLSHRVDRWLNRGHLLEDMLRLERLLDDFRVNFSDNRLVQIEIHMSTLLGKGAATSSGRDISRPPLPPKPRFMYGREREKACILATLLNPSSPARVAILGAGGIGKTTLAVSVLYDPSVIVRYDSRFFVACDGVTSAELLLTELANVLRLPRNQLEENMHDLVLASFRRDSEERVLLCFDNLETAWDNLATRRAVDDLLMEFADIQNLALLVTMRGTQRPAPSAEWSTPSLPPLHSLNFAAAANIFRHASGGQMDEHAEYIIKAVDCIPLAVTLAGHMVQEENETTASLAKRWEREHTALIENGGDDRLSKLDTSIQYSISSPRMRADASATNILALLSLLPDGFPNREGMLDRLQSYLPPEVNLHKAVSTLRRVALVHGETLANTPRLRSLSPVRLFSQANLQIPPRFRTALVDLYIDLLIEGRDYSLPNSHVFIPPELLNIRSVFVDAYKTGDRREALIRASIIYTDWLVFMGSGSDEIIQLAIQSLSESDQLLASCFYWLGKLCMRRNAVEEAHRAFARAIQLHIQAQDATGEAYDLYELGSLYIWWGKLQEAEESFKRAMKLHVAKGDSAGEAWALLDLGKLLMRRGKLEEAEKATSTALELLKDSHDVLGQAHALRRLGGVYMRQDRLDEAEEALCEAVKLHQQTSCILGEAHDMRRLGGLYMWRHQLDEAETSFIKAADLHRSSHDLLGEANDCLDMGALHLMRGRLSEAESALKHALGLHIRTQNVLGRANVMQMQGALHISKMELVDAGSFLSEAVKLHRQAGDILGLAKDWQKIGEMHELGREIDEAEEAYNKAVKFHQQACNSSGQAYGLKSLAELYTQRGELQVAMKLLMRAAELRARTSSAEVSGELDMELRLRELEQRCKNEGYG